VSDAGAGHRGEEDLFARVNPRTRKELFASLVPGTELGWGIQAQGPEPSANIFDQYRYVVFKDAKWDWRTFDWDKDAARGELPENLPMNATDPDMKKFFARSGKLLLYHGLSDPQVATLNTIKYYESVVENLGAWKSVSSVRLFLAPWATAAAAKDRMSLTRSAHSNSGSNMARRLTC